MMLAWSVAIIFLALLGGLSLAYRQLKQQLRQEQLEMARLRNRISVAQNQLADRNARRKKLLSASTQALFIVERDFTISSSNKVARRLFGSKPKKEATLMTWTRQHHLQELVEKTLEGEKMPPVHFNYNDRHLEARARVIKQNKEAVAVAMAIHDVTDFQRLTRMRRDFVANVSHELRTPVASIQLLSETLLKGALNDKKLAPQLIEKIGTQSDLLSQLAQELMDLSMIESGQVPLKLALYPLYDLAKVQVERLLPQAERKNLKIELDIPKEVIVLADQTMIGRVIGNLLHNAIKFTDTGVVTISADPAALTRDEAGDAWIPVSVSDTGVGISPHEIERIFERFYKIDQARDRKKAGTGLGLSIAKHVVEAHGGRIWANSDGHNGTTFYFTLPVEEERPVQEPAHQASALNEEAGAASALDPGLQRGDGTG